MPGIACDLLIDEHGARQSCHSNPKIEDGRYHNDARNLQQEERSEGNKKTKSALTSREGRGLGAIPAHSRSQNEPPTHREDHRPFDSFVLCRLAAMFSPVGLQKVMLENYRRSLSTGDKPSSLSPALSRADSLSPTPGSENSPLKFRKSLSRMGSLDSFASSDSGSGTKGRRNQKGIYSTIRNKRELMKILEDNSPAGKAFQKIANIAKKFDKDRDAVLISAFETTSLTYSDFRSLLKKMFLIDFTEEEFDQFCHLFDPSGLSEVNGSEFVVVFTILSNLLKDEKRKEEQERRERDELKARQRQEKYELRMGSIEESVVDYQIKEEDRTNALKKIEMAARTYDRTHHTAKSVKAFEVASMSPIEFRDALKGIFDITLTPKELGALVLHYGSGRDLLIPPLLSCLPPPCSLGR
jgi:hypothetical protein